MAEQVLNTEVTEYMKGLDKVEIEAIIADVQDIELFFLHLPNRIMHP